LRVSEQFEDIADRAFVRAWSALTPERFQEFSGLAAILAYLRTCVTSVLLDLARAENARERMLHSLTFSLDASPEEIVLSEMDNTALWRMVSSLVESRQDAAVLLLNIVLGLPSRHVLALRPYLFSSVDDVYRAKRNLIGRLKRSRDLQRWLVEYTA
jgi:DNA-directed RNA polymerase specialized sigma24 family protein